jgi:hypothetical protein
VPNVEMLAIINCAMLDTMTLQLANMPGTGSTCAENAASAASDALAHVEFNEEQAKAAYFHVYKFIQEQERGGAGAGWKPQHTGLVLTEAPPGKGRSVWVSPAGMGRFMEEGKDAIKKTKLNWFELKLVQ